MLAIIALAFAFGSRFFLKSGACRLDKGQYALSQSGVLQTRDAFSILIVVVRAFSALA
jgi:hypothetical protein